MEHAVGEAASGGSYVDAGEVSEVEMPVGERVLELEAAAADVFEVGAEEADGSVGWDRGAGFVDALLVDEDAAGEDEGLGSLTRGGVAAVDEELVEADFFGADSFGVFFPRVRHAEGRIHLFMVIDKALLAEPGRE